MASSVECAGLDALSALSLVRPPCFSILPGLLSASSSRWFIAIQPISIYDVYMIMVEISLFSSNTVFGA